MSGNDLPYDIEIEKSLLANIIFNDEAMKIVLDNGITSADFYDNNHQKLFSIMSSMYDNNEKIDVVTVKNKLNDYKIFETIGGINYLFELCDEIMLGTTNVENYARIIKNKSFARKIIKAGEEIATSALDTKQSVDEMLDNAEEKILKITQSRVNSDFQNAPDVFESALKKIDETVKNGSKITGVKSCYKALDNYTNGFQNSDFIILAARPSIGKTAFALNLALNAASFSPGAVVFFSYEMPAQQLALRMISAKSKVNGQRIRSGELDEQEIERINEAVQLLKGHSKFFIDDNSNQKVSDMLAKCRKLKIEHGLSIVFIDYIQLISGSSNSFENRQQEVAEISRKLKAMARELNCPVIALSQFSREVEKRDRKPILSDLRESGSLEQDADLVLFLHRKDFYKHDEDVRDREDIDVIIAKHRNGPTGEIQLAFEKSYNAFYSISKDKTEV